MGLDWNPGNKAKPGLEAEYEKLIRAMDSVPDGEREALRERFFEVSISPYETLQAPRVGFDAAADEWARARYRDNRSAAGSEEELVAKLRGFYVIDLVPVCDGIPPYSNGAAGYVEPFSFRAQFLVDCKEVIGDALLGEAYQRKSAANLDRYGAALLASGRTYAKNHGCAWVEEVRDDWDRIGDSEEGTPSALAHIILCAAEWCLFWSSKGHVLDPYF